MSRELNGIPGALIILLQSYPRLCIVGLIHSQIFVNSSSNRYFMKTGIILWINLTWLKKSLLSLLLIRIRWHRDHKLQDCFDEQHPTIVIVSLTWIHVWWCSHNYCWRWGSLSCVHKGQRRDRVYRPLRSCLPIAHAGYVCEAHVEAQKPISITGNGTFQNCHF